MFDKIAKDWARKRQKPWIPLVSLFDKWESCWREEYYQSISKDNCMFIDLGAGTGRHSEYFLQFCSRLVDLDQSREMLQKNSASSLKIQAHMDFLPLRNDKFDGVCSIAALHHIKGKSNRTNVIQEIMRVGLSNALICITVWRFYQKKFIKEFIRQLEMDMMQELNHEIGDVIVPWTLSQNDQKIIIDRFYHLFRSVEFNRLVHPLLRLHKSTMGNRGQKTNFCFMGVNPKI